MGLPARRLEDRAGTSVLRLLRGGRGRTSRPASRKSRNTAAQIAYHKRLFQTAIVALILVMGVALARVQVTVQATEASMIANSLKVEIESERVRTEMLEADRSALATPARIESIAGGSMGMGVAEEIDYLAIPSSAEVIGNEGDPAPELADAVTAPGRTAAVLAEIMRMTAGEAQVLLVGDAAIVSAR